MGFFYFLGRRRFYLHFLIASVATVVLFWIVLMSMDIFTKHGDVYIVPDFDGQTLDQMYDNGYGEYFEFSIIDSVYFRTREKGTVVMQNPLQGSKVKQGRHIYLTIVAQAPEKVIMPNLKNLSLRQALVTLESEGLRVNELEYVQYFARNAVVDQLIGDEPVDPGTELVKGTFVNLVLGKGDYPVLIPMPFLIGLKPSELRKNLHHNSLNVGKEYFLDDNDTTHARVYKTDPKTLSEDMLILGQPVNIWYRSDELMDFDEYIMQFNPDTIAARNAAQQEELLIEQDEH